MNADQLRNTFTEFFVERGHLALPAASLVPNDPSMLFTIAGMVQFKPYFLGRVPAARAAGDHRAAVRAHRRHRRDRHDLAPRHLLRDARELQLRGLLQGPGDRVRLGAVHRAARPRPRTSLGHGARLRRRGRCLVARRARPAPGAPAATRRGQLLEDGRDRSVRAELGDLLRPWIGVRRRRGTGPGGRALRRALEPGVHAVRPARRRLADPASPAEHRHRGRAGPDPHPDPGRRVGVRHRPRRAHPRGGVGRHRARRTGAPRRATSASASSPTTPAPSPS